MHAEQRGGNRAAGGRAVVGVGDGAAVGGGARRWHGCVLLRTSGRIGKCGSAEIDQVLAWVRAQRDDLGEGRLRSRVNGQAPCCGVQNRCRSTLGL